MTQGKKAWDFSTYVSERLSDVSAELREHSRHEVPGYWVAETNVWQTPTLLNSWVNFGAPYNAASYLVDSNRFVQLKGLVRNGIAVSGTIILTLPSGYRPNGIYIFATMSNSALGEVRVESNGNVTIHSGSNLWISLDVVRFSLP